MNLMDVFVKIGADTSDLESGVSKSEGIVSKLGSGFGSAMKVAGEAVAGATVAVGAFAASSVKVGASFDSSMAQVAATMGVTVDEIDNLREFAQDMGAKTAFSATQAADALNYMALAGYDAEQSMTMLPNVLNLAAAGDMELARASDMVTDAQSALGLQMEEMDGFVDQLAKTASKSNTSVSQLGEAILTIGGTAKIMSGGTTELNTALGILADNGIKGSEGGTKLRNVLLSLSAPTDKAATMLESLGVQAVDTATGDLRPLEEIMGDLSASLDGLGTAERAEVINTIFNKQDIAAVNALLDTNSDRWDELSMEIDGAWLVMDDFKKSLSDTGISFDAMDASLKKIGISTEDFEEALKYSKGDAEAFAEIIGEWSDEGTNFNDVLSDMGISLDDVQKAMDATAGAAQQMADTQLDNLNGDITLFKSALEGAQIQISDALTPSLREFVQFGTDGLGKIADAFKEGGLTGAMEASGTVLSDGLNMVIDKLPSFIDAGMKLLGALGQGLLDNLPTIVDAAVKIVDQLAMGFLSALPAVAKGAVEIIAGLANGLAQMAPKLIPAAVESVAQIVKGLIDNVPMLVNAAVNLVQGLVDGIINAIPVLVAAIPVLLDSLIKALVSAIPMLINGTMQLIQGLVQALPTIINSLIQAIPTIISLVINGLLNALPALIQGHVQLMIALVNALPQIIQVLVNAIPQVVNTIVTALVNNMPALINGAIQLVMGIVKAIPQIMSALIAAVPQIIGMLVSALLSAAPLLLSAVVQILAAVGSTLLSYGSNFVSNVGQTMSNILNTVVQWLSQLPEKMAYWAGYAIGSFIKFVAELPSRLVSIFNTVISRVTTFGTNFANKARETAKQFYNNMVNNIASLPSKISGLANQLVSAVSSLPSKFTSIGKNIVDGLWNGIKGGWDWLKDKVAGLADSLFQGAKEALGIASPSKKFKWIGQMIDEGLASGIDKFSYLVDGSLGNLGALDYVNTAQPQIAMAGGYGSGDYNQTINIYSPTALTPSEVARQTRNATRDMVLELRGKR